MAALAVAQQIPEAKLERSLAYSGPEGSVTVVGACKFSDSDVICWNEQGKTNKSLTEEVRRTFQDPNGPSVSIKLGSKVRLIVCRFELPPTELSSSASMEDRFDDSSGIDIGRRPSYNSSQFRSFLRGRFVTVEKDTKTSSVAIRVRRTFNQSEPVPLKEGTTFRYLDTTIKIIKIVKSDISTSRYGYPTGSRWLIHHSYDPVRTWHLEWGATDKEGLPIHAVDADGKAKYVDPAAMQSLRNRWFGGTVASNEVPASIMPSGYWVDNYGLITLTNRPVLVTNVDPGEIKEIVLKASSQQLIVLKDVPLDPK